MKQDQSEFWTLLDMYPFLWKYWDRASGTCDFALLEADLGCLSHGEQVLARFLGSIWEGSNTRMKFDLIEAVGVLPQEDRDRIARWTQHPVWP